MEDFAKWFNLSNRENFTIDPQVYAEDAKYYFGREDIKNQLQKQIRLSFIDPGVPKIMVWGPYGSGKTQTLFYLMDYLCKQPPESLKGAPHVKYLTIEMRSNSTAGNFHMQLMEELGKETVSVWVRKLFDSHKEFDNILLKNCADDSNIYKALKELRATGESTFMAWRWLTGQALTAKELNGLQITRNLGIGISGDLVNSLVAIGNLANQVDEKILFLIDEMEQLQNVRVGDSTESIHDYIRKLSEKTNKNVGFLIGFKADVIDDAPELLRRGDIYGRIGGNNYVDIPPLPAVDDVKSFIKELLMNLTDADGVKRKIKDSNLESDHGIFPFDRGSFELLADYSTQDPTKALPRNIISAINQCAIQAWDEKKQLIDESIINDIASHIFQ
ncbi:MAG: hypothetical protein ACYC59_04325 [Anaerolineaceae bacterium]